MQGNSSNNRTANQFYLLNIADSKDSKDKTIWNLQVHYQVKIRNALGFVFTLINVATDL